MLFVAIGFVAHLFLFVFTLSAVLAGTIFSRWLYFGFFTALLLYNLIWALLRPRKSHVIRILCHSSLMLSAVFYFCILLPAIIWVKEDSRFGEYVFIFPLAQIASWVVWMYAFKRRFLVHI